MDNRQSVSKARVQYTQEGRSGTVHFVSPAASFDMWFEFAGGNALAIVDIPTPQHWEARTKLPLSQRSQVLTFIGKQIVADQAPGGSFTLSDDTLTIYAGQIK